MECINRNREWNIYILEKEKKEKLEKEIREDIRVANVNREQLTKFPGQQRFITVEEYREIQKQKEKIQKDKSIDKEWEKNEYQFSDDFVDNEYPEQQSQEKKDINKMLVNSVKKSGIPEDSQIYLILESTKLNTIRAILSYNKTDKVKIYVPECITETCYKIANSVYKSFPNQREQIDFYPGNKLDYRFIRELSEDKIPFPNIAFLDFTNTFNTNHSTINEILKIWKKDSDSIKVLALTFSLRGEHHSIDKYNCGFHTDDISVIGCVTKQIFKLLSIYKFIPKNVFRLKYQRTIPGKISGRIVYHCYTISKTKNKEKLTKIRDMSIEDINKNYPIQQFKK